MIGNIKIDCADEAEYEGICVSFNIRYYTRDWFNTSLLYGWIVPPCSVYGR